MAPRIDGLSQHQVTSGSPVTIFVRGSGFRGVTGVQVGDQWVADHRVDGEEVITITPPDLPGGQQVWVIVHTAEGTSPCDGDAQLLEYAAAGGTGELRLDGITPAEVTLGTDEPYWLQGAGLNGVTHVFLADNGCRFEGYDDTRLLVYVGAEHPGAAPGHSAKLEVHGQGARTASLEVMVRGRPAGPGPDDAAWPVVASVEPASLPAAGGEVRVHGSGFDRVATVLVGTVACTDFEWVSSNELRVTVPDLTGHEGQSLAVVVATPDHASPESSAHVAVEAG